MLSDPLRPFILNEVKQINRMLKLNEPESISMMDESLSFSLRQDLSFPLCLSADHKRVTYITYNVEGSFL